MLVVGLLISVMLIVATALYSGTHRSQEGMGPCLVSGVLLGTIVGGSCTIGTAQLAYLYGACAWWFCLGCTVALIVLALVFALPFRQQSGRTILCILSSHFDNRVGMTASILSSVGTFISILCQLIAATSVIAVIVPTFPLTLSLLSAAVFMIVYVIFGGTRGAGLVGMVKLALVYASMILCGAIVLTEIGGLDNFFVMVNGIPNERGIDFLSVFGLGIGKEIGSCVALIIGVASTQIYAQSLCAARSDGVARWGSILGALLIPIIGAMGILVGLYMRAHFPEIPPKTALTQFVLLHTPELVAGVILGTLFVTVVGTGAGLALGIATVINNDIIQVLFPKQVDVRTKNRRIRLGIGCVLLSAAVACALLDSDLILNYAFLSMGLRGTVVFAPLCFALWVRSRINPLYPLTSAIVAPLVEFGLHLFADLPVNPLFVGVAVSFGIMAIGWTRSDKTVGLRP
jgi:SSS family solute:Na+ symporter